MAVIRVEKNRNFTTMSNYHLRDKDLSLKAKDLLSQILSLPDDWDYSVRGLASICLEGKDCIVTTLKELEIKGYLVRKQFRDANGRLGGIEYIIYETPPMPCMEKPDTVKQNAGRPNTGRPDEGKPPQLNTNKTKTKEIKDREKKEPRHKYGAYGNVLLPDEDFEKLMVEFPADYTLRIERLSEYMASTGKSYKNHLATIRSWARKEKPSVQRGYSHDIYKYEEGESL